MARLLQLLSAHQADLFQDNAFPDKTATTGHFLIVYEDTGDTFATWDGRMPPTYNNGNISVDLHWASTTTTLGGCRWQVAFERLDQNGQPITSSGFSPNLSVTANPSSTPDALVYTSIAFSNAQADGVQAGESFRIRLTRNTSHVEDTMVGSGLVLNIGIIEV